MSSSDPSKKNNSDEKSKKENNAITIFESKNHSFFDTLKASICLLVFISTWISSLASPFLLYGSIYYRNYTLLSIIVLLITLAYTPWSSKSFLPYKLRSFIATNHPKYYTSCSVTYTNHTPSNTNHKKTFYAIHPHGIFCLGWSILFASPELQHVKFCFSPALFLSPFFRLFARILGNPGYADKKSMLNYMKQGIDLALPPGGFEEATISTTTKDRVYIKRRVGFVKLCLQHQYDEIVPVYCFGEKDTFWNLQGLWNLRVKTLNGMGVPAIVPYGMFCLPLMPKRSEGGLHVVAGEPIKLPKLEGEIKREDVAFWHGKYVEGLTKLIQDYNKKNHSNVDAADGKEPLMDVDVW